MRTLLLISRYFPPLFDVGGKRPYRFARYLHQHGWRTVVWTSPIPEGRPVDSTPLRLPPEVKLIREFRPRWQRESKGRLSDGTCEAPVADRGGRTPWFRVPVDWDILWTSRMVSRLREVVEQEQVDAILATSSPYSVLVLGALLKWSTGLPLCLDLRDPWTLNFLHRQRPRWVRRLDSSIEKRLFRLADRVVFTCDSATAAYRELYPGLPPEKLTTITNSFDPIQRPSGKIQEGPVQLVHFGNCYGSRSLVPVLEAVALLRKRGQLGSEQVEIVNLGRIAASDLNRAAELGVEGHLQYQPVVSYEVGLGMLAAADLQILLPYGEETLFVPAKLYDYLRTGTPILCLSRPSELTEYVGITGSGRCVSPEDTEAVADVIAKAVEARDGGPPVCTPRAEAINRFSAPETTARLARLLDEMISGR